LTAYLQVEMWGLQILDLRFLIVGCD